MRLSSEAARREVRFFIDKEKRKEGRVLVANDVQQIGFQLSLLLNGKSIPKAAFSEGIIPFQSIYGVEQ
jgi:hypothetical protein